MPRRGPDGRPLTGSAKQKLKDEAMRAAVQEKFSRWNASDLRAFAALERRDPTAAGAYQESLEALRLVLRRAARNPALTPQQRHEMVGRHAAALIKAADPGRIIQQLSEELREALKIITSLEAKLAARTPARSTGGDPAAAVQ